MHYYFKEGKNTTETPKIKMRVMYGEGAMTDRTCPVWFVKFLGTVDILAKYSSLLWGCLVHWKMFSSTPGLYPLETNSRREPTYSKNPNQ